MFPDFQLAVSVSVMINNLSGVLLLFSNCQFWFFGAIVVVFFLHSYIFGRQVA